MFNCCVNTISDMPDVTIYMNCDTRLAINLRVFELSDYDEFIFVIKNYNYIDSSYVFLFGATKADIDEHGEVIFNIDPDASKQIKPGAFYTFALLKNANNPTQPTEYVKLTKNGKINIEYGAHDLALTEPEAPASPFSEIIAARLDVTDEEPTSHIGGVITDLRFERRPGTS